MATFIAVHMTVQKPAVHIIGWSSSPIQHQLLLTETRRECLKELKETLKIQSGEEALEVICVLYGPGPAAQFEAGHKLGGNYYCIGCGAHSACFTDIA